MIYFIKQYNDNNTIKKSKRSRCVDNPIISRSSRIREGEGRHSSSSYLFQACALASTSASTSASAVSATISSISSKRIDQFYTIAGLIDGCAKFVPGFNVDDIYVVQRVVGKIMKWKYQTTKLLLPPQVMVMMTIIPKMLLK